jgi:hypothetical protein
VSSSKSAGGTKSAAKSRGMVIRTVVWGTLGVLVVLTLLDMKSRVAAQRTRDAWQAAQKEKVDSNRDLHRSDLEPMIQGSPSLPPVEEEADRHQDICRKVLRYTWPGIVRDYTVSVYLGLGQDASVEFIEGPGKVVPAEDEGEDAGRRVRAPAKKKQTDPPAGQESGNPQGKPAAGDDESAAAGADQDAEQSDGGGSP